MTTQNWRYLTALSGGAILGAGVDLDLASIICVGLVMVTVSLGGMIFHTVDKAP
jgi:hypothetical protein